jgi:hypothetical protein
LTPLASVDGSATELPGSDHLTTFATYLFLVDEQPLFASHATGRLADVDGIRRHDSVIFDADPEKSLESLPQLFELVAFERLTGPFRVNSKRVEHIRAKHVADAGNDRLIEQKRADSRAAASNSFPCDLGIGISAQGVLPQTSGDFVAISWLDNFAGGGAIQVEGVPVADHTDSYGTTRFGRWTPMVSELAVQAEMNVKDQ